MADQRTSFTIEAKARGFAQVDKAAQGLRGSLGSVKLNTASVKSYAQGLSKLSASTKALNKQLADVGNLAAKNVTNSFTKMGAAMKAVNAQVHATWETMKRLAATKPPPTGSDDQFGPTIPGGDGGGGGGGRRRKRKPSDGSFTQGLLEGVMPGFRVIDRGPGAVRQASGIAVGSLGRSLGSMPFTGGSIGNALGGTFGVLSSPIARLEQQADNRIGFEKQQLGMQSLLGGFGVTHQMPGFSDSVRRRAGLTNDGIANAARQAREHTLAEPIGFADEKYIRAQRSQDLDKHADAIIGGLGGQRRHLSKYQIQRYQKMAQSQVTSDADYIASAHAKRAEDAASAAGRGASQQADALVSRARHAALSPLMTAGRQYGGMALPAAQQFAAQMAQAGGGQAGDIAKQGMLQSSFAANTALGIGAQTSGAFMQAGRIGGAGVGSGNAQFTKAIEQGMQLGLRGSELTDYMQQMASSIESWKTTGIPLEKDSISAMGQELQKSTGLAGPRAAIAAQAGVTGLQNLGRQGAQSGEDILKMRSFGGLGKNGTDYFQAAENLEEITPDQVKKGMGDFTSNAIKQGGLGIGMQSRSLQKAYGDLGVNMSLRESRITAMRSQGMKLSDKDEAYYNDSQKRITTETQQALAGKNFKGTAKGMAGGIAGAEAGRENRELMMGGALIKSNQAMKDAADNTAQAFSKLSPLINDFASSIKSLTGWMMHLPFVGGNSSSSQASDGG